MKLKNILKFSNFIISYNKELKKMLRDNLYVTASLCKFLFGKRKSISSLSALCTLQEFLNALTVQSQQQAICDKLEFLKSRAH